MGKIAAIVDNNNEIIKTNDLNNNHHEKLEQNSEKSSSLKLNGFCNSISSSPSSTTTKVGKIKNIKSTTNKMNGKNNNLKSTIENSKRLKLTKKSKKNSMKKKKMKNGSSSASSSLSNPSSNTSLSSSISSLINNDNITTTNNQKKISSYQDSTNILTYFDPNKKVRDPLAMVECHRFDDSIQQPVVVKIKLEALLLMDLHAHCSHNEIIGCLGGYYCRVTKTLYVLTAIPGSSVEGQYNQCELDPVSYVHSLDIMEKRNLQMVGWYHSHPKFLAKPSIIDIQTQKYNQGVFFERYNNNNCNNDNNNNHHHIDDKKTKIKTKKIDKQMINDNENQDNLMNENERSFVGFIITPFLMQPNGSSTLTSSKSFQRYQPCSERSIGSKFIANNICYNYHHNHYSSYCYFTPELNSILASTIKCFWVSGPQFSKDPLKNNPQRSHCLVPYEIETTLIRDECFISSFANGLSDMCIKLFSKIDDRNSIVDLFKQFTRIGSININYLEKVIASLSHHLQNPNVNYLCTEEEFARIRDQCVAILTQELFDGNRKTQGRIHHHHRYR